MNSIRDRKESDLRRGLNSLRTILLRKPDEINSFLYVAAQNLLTPDWRDELEQMQSSVIAMTPQPANTAEFLDRCERLEALDSIIRQHYQWQLIDTEVAFAGAPGRC